MSVGITPAAYKGKPGRDGKPPIIGENGNWWQYDYKLDAYIDSGKPASVCRAIYTADNLEQLPEVGNNGIIYVVTDKNELYRWDPVSTSYQQINPGGNSAAGATYVHKQPMASAIWDVKHDLDKYPAVSVVDSAGTQVYGDVQYIDSNHLRIIFTSEFGGKAYLN